MRILIPLVGSRGDVQPGVALGLELVMQPNFLPGEWLTTGG